jgi:NAD(P)-dependent dehydrogenase (short-subunit alcohol dehydrogenase family)
MALGKRSRCDWLQKVSRWYWWISMPKDWRNGGGLAAQSSPSRGHRLGCRSATADAAAAAAQELGGAHGLSHNAGIQRYGSALDTSQQCWDEVMATNLGAAFLLAQALLPQLIAKRGALVFMASVQGLASQRNVAAYTASKHGLIGLSKSIAVDFASQGVRSNAIAPGSIDTPMLRDAIASAPSPLPCVQKSTPCTPGPPWPCQRSCRAGGFCCLSVPPSLPEKSSALMVVCSPASAAHPYRTETWPL